MTSSARHGLDPEEAEEKPLDPAAERLQERLKTLVRFSSLIMAGGMLAVFSVILYRVVNGGGAAPANPPATIAVPAAAGETIVAASPAGDRLSLILQAADGSRSVAVVDLASGRVLTRVVLAPGAEAVPPAVPPAQ